jgi:hypothetical protein
MGSPAWPALPPTEERPASPTGLKLAPASPAVAAPAAGAPEGSDAPSLHADVARKNSIPAAAAERTNDGTIMGVCQLRGTGKLFTDSPPLLAGHSEPVTPPSQRNPMAPFVRPITKNPRMPMGPRRQRCLRRQRCPRRHRPAHRRSRHPEKPPRCPMSQRDQSHRYLQQHRRPRQSWSRRQPIDRRRQPPSRRVPRAQAHPSSAARGGCSIARGALSGIGSWRGGATTGNHCHANGPCPVLC